MTASIIPWREKTQTNSTEEVSLDQFLNSLIEETNWVKPEGRSPIFKSGSNSTTYGEDIIRNDNIKHSPIDRIYPHVFDEEIEDGQVVVIINKALNDAQSALEAFGEPDLQTVTTRLTQIAAAMSKAHPLTSFNQSLGAVVSFIRRATLVTSIDDISRSALNALVQVFLSIASNPMIDLDDASDLVDILSNEGWRGEHGVADQLIALILSDSDLNVDDQNQLSSESQIENP